MLETQAEVPGLPRLVRGLFEWLGFRYLRLRAVGETLDAVVPTTVETPIAREAVAA